MTTEQKLQAIIEAQVKGGYRKYFPHSGEWRGITVSQWGGVELRETLVGGSLWNILQILLDPQGLRAAYGDVKRTAVTGDERRNMILNAVIQVMEDAGKFPARWEHVAIQILLAWLSSNGDANATIDTAYSLLPKT